MKKSLLILLLALLITFTLTACGGGDGDENDGTNPPSGDNGTDNGTDDNTPDDGDSGNKPVIHVVYNENVVPRLVYSDKYGTEYVDVIAMAIDSVTGKTPLYRDETSRAVSREIVVGNTLRDISAKAAEYLEKNKPTDSRYGNFLIYSEGSSIAIVADHDALLGQAVSYFVSTYVLKNTLVLEKALVDVVSPATPSEDYAWAVRFDVYKDIFDEDAIEQLAKLYGLFDDNYVKWLAGLYTPYICVCGNCDPNSDDMPCYGGGFYYSNSARDTYGFYPDVESTAQAFTVLISSGILTAYNNNVAEALPKEMKDAIVKFVQTLQSPTDKFFYHPQWGTSVNSSRRGRDLDSALGILRRLGAEPIYGSPLEASASAKLTRPLSSNAVLASSAALAGTLPDYLASEQAFEAWLNGLGINEKSYQAGHTISSIRSQIKSAGLDEFCINWLNSRQVDNGLWESGKPNYSKTNGLLKIATIYESFNKPMPRVDLGIDAFITMLHSGDEVTAITDIYNIWVGLGILLPNAKQFASAETYNDAIAELYADAEIVFKKTYEKLTVFRKSDSSYSYFPKKSAAESQGEIASLGVNEGDVNASALALSTLGHMCKALGIEKLQTFHSDSFKVFLDVISNYTYKEKNLIANETITFNGATDDTLSFFFTFAHNGQTTGTPGSVTVKNRPENSKNQYVEFVSGLQSGDSLYFTIPDLGPTSMFYLDLDLKLAGGGSQIFLGNSVMINITGSGENILLSSLNARSGATITDQITTVKADEWFRFRVEHYPEVGKTKYFVNGEFVKESDVFLGSDGTDATKPTTSFTRVELYASLSADVKVSFDNVLYDRTADTYVEPGKESYLFGNGYFYRLHGGLDYDLERLPENFWSAGDLGLNATASSSPDGYAKISTVDGNKVLEGGKPSGAARERHIGIPATVSAGNYFIFETDFYLDGEMVTSNKDDPWLIRISMQHTSGSDAASRRFIAPLLYMSEGGLTVGKNAIDKFISFNEWHNIAIVYDKVNLTYELILDGTVIAKSTGLSLREGFYGVSFEFRAHTSNAKVYLDNTVCTAVDVK